MPYRILGKCLVGDGEREEMLYPLQNVKRVYFTRGSDHLTYIDLNGMTLEIRDTMMLPDPAIFKQQLKAALLDQQAGAGVQATSLPAPSAPRGNSVAELQSRLMALRTSGGSKRRTRRTKN